MKKAVQENINSICLNAIELFNDSMEKGGTYDHYKRLRSCTAWVYENRDYIWLRSYNTIIAFYDKSNGTFYDILRYVFGYTNTSGQHIAKFRNDYARNAINYYTYRAV